MKNYTLPKEFGEKWIEALRATPEEKHGKGKYYDNETECYCAMGLGCAQMPNVEVKENYIVLNGSDFPFSWDIKGQIVELNDSKNKSFSEIADWIETNVELT